MLYNVENKEIMLDALQNKVSNIIDIMVALAQEGYVTNKQKYVKLDWAWALSHAYQNIDVLTTEQHKKLDVLFNQINAI